MTHKVDESSAKLLSLVCGNYRNNKCSPGTKGPT